MKIITHLLIGVIKIYKLFISPLFPNSCKFEPTCSTYCIDALKTYGLIKGIASGMGRICLYPLLSFRLFQGASQPP